MAAYATALDLQTRKGEQFALIVGDRDGDGGLDTLAVDAALDTATSQINGYLGAQYALPLTTVPDSVKQCCVEMAMYHLAGQHPQLTDEISARYDRCIAWLQAIATGEAQLDEQGGNATDGGNVQHTTEERIFTRTTMRGVI